MILFVLTLIILAVLAAFLLTIGTGLIAVFGDVIVFVLIIVGLVKLFKRFRKRR